jgi:hypothetical protein
MKNSADSADSAGGGVILKPPTKKKQIACSKRWVFTLNNYTEEHINIISAVVPEKCIKYIIGKEISKSGTPHLQGFCYFKERVRPLSEIPIKEIHWEKALGNDLSQNYCGKDDDVILFKGIPKPLVLVTRDMLRPNQLKIADMFIEDEHPIFGRNIYWFWEEHGNWGKSFLCTHMIDFMGAMEVSGASADVLCGVTNWIEKNGEAPRIIIFDIPRVNKGHVSYQAIEKIKDGKFFSGKYESGMVRFNKPHILCFANEEPEDWKLSKDRWKVQEL